jgi:hypothetical protein
MKDTVYKAIARLAQHPNFYTILVNLGEVPIVCYELTLRRKSDSRKNRRSRLAAGEEDDGTEKLFSVMRQDWAVSRIQSIFRRQAGKAVIRERRGTRMFQTNLREKEIVGVAAAKESSNRNKQNL